MLFKPFLLAAKVGHMVKKEGFQNAIKRGFQKAIKKNLPN